MADPYYRSRAWLAGTGGAEWNVGSWKGPGGRDGHETSLRRAGACKGCRLVPLQAGRLMAPGALQDQGPPTAPQGAGDRRGDRPHLQVVMAVEKARLSMQLASQIRTKATEAINDIFHHLGLGLVHAQRSSSRCPAKAKAIVAASGRRGSSSSPSCSPSSPPRRATRRCRTGLDPAETGKITAALDEAGVGYELRSNGTALAVEKSQDAQAQVALAEAGLGGSRKQPGYELLKEQKLGASDFQQRQRTSARSRASSPTRSARSRASAAPRCCSRSPRTSCSPTRRSPPPRRCSSAVARASSTRAPCAASPTSSPRRSRA